MNPGSTAHPGSSASPGKTRVVIAGGGTAGWLTAFSLVKRLGALLDITLVESDLIGTVGVGEATIPTIKSFHNLMEIDEREFMAATQATFKLGIYFDHWANIGDSYIHSFGVIGQGSWMAEFHEYWLELRAQGLGGSLEDYCLEWKAAKQGKFAIQAGKTNLNYAYHLNATAYAQYLRGKSEGLGAKRVEGKITKVRLSEQTGNIESLDLEGGVSITGDFFIDCTGFRGLLLGEALGVGYEDWGHWLGADSAWAVQSESAQVPPPYTRATAHAVGWQWRIPLQHRTGNGIVYNSHFCSDDEARAVLMKNLQGPAITEPRQLKFRTGRRQKLWHKNCVAIGLAAGFLEPLESTSIHLITTAAIRLMRLFPFSGECEQQAERFNAESNFEWEEVRDFIILHYKQTRRDDSPFWKHYREMEVPHNLTHRIEIFRKNGYVWPDKVNLFRIDSWIQVMMGQGVFPERHHGATRIPGTASLDQTLGEIRAQVTRNLALLPEHQSFLEQYCPAANLQARPLTKRQLQEWNQQKWEVKNHAMYETHARNQWPWYNDKLDRDIEEYLAGAKLASLDILDLGTCSGSQGIELARRGHRVVGTDISETALDQAKLAASRENGLAISFLIDDIAESRLADNHFDLVLDRGCYHSICTFNHDEYVANIRRILRPDGILLLKTMSSEEKRFIAYDKVGGQEVQMPFHFTEQQLQTLLAPHFQIEELRESYFYSSVLEEPARARFVILRNRK
jgi:tryptophan 7-halogenase